jgi:hypothetical protein
MLIFILHNHRPEFAVPNSRLFAQHVVDQRDGNQARRFEIGALPSDIVDNVFAVMDIEVKAGQGAVLQLGREHAHLSSAKSLHVVGDNHYLGGKARNANLISQCDF